MAELTLHVTLLADSEDLIDGISKSAQLVLVRGAAKIFGGVECFLKKSKYFTANFDNKFKCVY